MRSKGLAAKETGRSASGGFSPPARRKRPEMRTGARLEASRPPLDSRRTRSRHDSALGYSRRREQQLHVVRSDLHRTRTAVLPVLSSCTARSSFRLLSRLARRKRQSSARKG